MIPAGRSRRRDRPLPAQTRPAATAATGPPASACGAAPASCDVVGVTVVGTATGLAADAPVAGAASDSGGIQPINFPPPAGSSNVMSTPVEKYFAIFTTAVPFESVATSCPRPG